jgi:hypothetical protein
MVAACLFLAKARIFNVYFLHLCSMIRDSPYVCTQSHCSGFRISACMPLFTTIGSDLETNDYRS